MRILAGILVGGFLGMAALAAVVAAQTVPPGSRPQTPPVVKGTGAILGQVLDDGTGQPIPEAVVTLFGRPSVPGALMRPDRVLTDDLGRFLFHDLGKGTFEVEATSPGYISREPRPVALEDGQRVTDIRIRLAKPAVVSGTVFDEAGDPAVGVTVYFTGPGSTGYGAATTDDRGMYRRIESPGRLMVAVPQWRVTMPAMLLDAMTQAEAAANGGVTSSEPAKNSAIRVGDLIVSSQSGLSPVVTSGDRLLTYQSVFYPAATSPADATILTLHSGEEMTGIDFHLRLVPTSRVSGSVTGPNGPAAYAVVELSPEGSVRTPFGFDSALARAAEDGTFTFLAVPPGAYVVKVVEMPLTGVDPALARRAQLATGNDPATKVLLFAEASIGVGTRDVSGVTLRLREGIKMNGRLQFDGAQFPPTGSSLQSWFVSLSPTGPGATGGPNVDQNGRFQTSAVVSGRYWVNASPLSGAADARRWIVKSVTIGGRDVSNDGVELKDADVNDVVVVLTDRAATLTGAVRGADASPPAGTSVFLVPARYQSWIGTLEMSRQRVRRIPVPPTGIYTFSTLAAGDYLLAAIDDAEIDGDEGPAFYQALARVATPVAIGENETRTQDLRIVKVVR